MKPNHFFILFCAFLTSLCSPFSVIANPISQPSILNKINDYPLGLFFGDNWSINLYIYKNSFYYYGVNTKESYTANSKNSVVLSNGIEAKESTSQKRIYLWHNRQYQYKVTWQPNNPNKINLIVLDPRQKVILNFQLEGDLEDRVAGRSARTPSVLKDPLIIPGMGTYNFPESQGFPPTEMQAKPINSHNTPYQCTESKIATINRDQQATEIIYRDINVAYDAYNSVLNITSKEKIGDRVQQCKVFKPDPALCPPNDTRGTYYRMYNYRLKVAYLLPDSKHLCGGA